MSRRIGEKRLRSSGRESDSFPPPRKQSRIDEEEPDDDEDSAGDFTFTQMQAQTQDEQEAIEGTKEMKNMASSDLIRVWHTPRYCYLICTCICAQIGEVGVIEKVQLTNFMCHSRLDVSFSPNVNFVLGRNGSESLYNFFELAS